MILIFEVREKDIKITKIMSYIKMLKFIVIHFNLISSVWFLLDFYFSDSDIFNGDLNEPFDFSKQTAQIILCFSTKIRPIMLSFLAF